MSDTTTYLGLALTPEDTTDTFKSWRTKINGEQDSNMTKIDEAIGEMYDNHLTPPTKVIDKDNSTTITVEGYEIDVKVNISAEVDNQIQVKSDGLYVPKPTDVDISDKADKVTGATVGNLAALDANGNLTDSGKNVVDFEIATDVEVSEMLEEVFGVTE